MNAVEQEAAVEFRGWPKMARLTREVVVTEKIDGTNAQVYIGEDGTFLAGCRTRWITPEADNHGFAAWAYAHRDELMTLGPGRHFGEWWGSGIQRGYGLTKGEKRFSLFNAIRWCEAGEEPQRIPTEDPRVEKWQQVAPECCRVVPVLSRATFDTGHIEATIDELRQNGSCAAPGYMKPEGVIVFHVAGNVGFKRTLDDDGVPKGVRR